MLALLDPQVVVRKNPDALLAVAPGGAALVPRCAERSGEERGVCGCGDRPAVVVVEPSAMAWRRVRNAPS